MIPLAVLLTIIALAIAAGVVFKILTGDEREGALQTALAIVHEVKHAARTRPEEAEFFDALKARERRVVIAPALLALNALVFLFMLFGSGPLAEPATLISWGASIGPRTTNGEWWRLVTAIFVHSGLFQVLIVSLGFAQIAFVLERLVGRLALAATYVLAGVLAGLSHLSTHQAALGFGGSGSVFGVYGLFLAYFAWQVITKSPLVMPRPAVKKLVPAACLFILYSASNDSLDLTAELTGLMCGGFCGLVALIGASDAKPSPRRAAAAIAACCIFAIGSAFPLRGFANIEPELDRLVTVEEQTSKIYLAADAKFHQRKITADALADLIDRQILPQFDESRTRLEAIHKVPREHQPMMDDAVQFVKLRAESWRSRAKGLRQIELRDLQKTNGVENAALWRRRADTQHRANLAMLGNADGKEHASLEVLQRIKKATFY